MVKIIGCFADTLIDRDLPFRGPYEISASDCVQHCTSKVMNYILCYMNNSFVYTRQ